MNTQEILSRCLDEIERGEATIEECLLRYPHLQGELEPLLAISERLRQASTLGMRPAIQRAGREYVTSLPRPAHARRPSRRRQWSKIHIGLRGFLRMSRRWAVAVSAVVVALVVGISLWVPTFYSLPGDFLYPVKRSAEQARLAVAPSEENRAQVHLDLAHRRLEEALASAERGQPKEATALIDEYEQGLRIVSLFIERQLEQGADISQLAERLERQLSRERQALDRAGYQVPEISRPVVETALEISEQTSREVTDALEEQPMVATTSAGPQQAQPGATPTPERTVVPAPDRKPVQPVPTPAPEVPAGPSPGQLAPSR